MRGISKKKQKKYDSKFEEKVDALIAAEAVYHPRMIQYQVQETRRYEPDWIIERAPMTILVEAKGRFRDRNEMNKYIHIANSLDMYHELVFVFQNPNTPLPGAQRRKDGTRRSMKEWADQFRFRWVTLKNLEDI